MLDTRKFSKIVSLLTMLALFAVGLPAYSEGGGAATSRTTGAPQSSVNETPQYIAQSPAASGAAELNPISLTATSSRNKEASPLVDSLWGNLILELAYDRDPGLKKIGKRMKIASLGTMAGITTVAGGTLGQVVSALAVLNPADGHLDSYTPIILGVALSSLTVMVFLAKGVANHVFAKQLLARKQEIKLHLESILARMESTDGDSADARNELTEMIGERACKEWVALYQSSHKLASTNSRKFSMSSFPFGDM